MQTGNTGKRPSPYFDPAGPGGMAGPGEPPRPRSNSFRIPGSPATLDYHYDEQGRLTRLVSQGRVYLQETGGERRFDGDLVTFSEVRLGQRSWRYGRARDYFWTEEYTWDSLNRLTRIDGVEIERDERGRVTACREPQQAWFYGYSGDHLAVIDGPKGVRHLTRDRQGRPLRARDHQDARDYAYDALGRREDVPGLPPGYHRDELGRLWTITGPDGRILTTYLWEGFACLGRIDGPPGQPLAAVFSLDPTCTPVRLITRQGVTRIARDAFGENLLDFPGVPGLFGGAIAGRAVYLRARSLDPRSASFTAPDPWHGRRDDPRRRDGFGGPLPVEHGSAGPYAICQHDPLGYADPTGEILTPLIILSDLTWGISNNIVGWLGLDWIVNFWGSIFTGRFGRFFSYEGLFDRRSGSFGVARDGALYNGRAFAFQHLIFESKDDLNRLNDARLFNPRGEFRPTLYGSLLRGVPSQGTPFLLSGSAPSTSAASPGRWSRNGGKAVAVVPGSPVPHFPFGGLHFDNVLRGTRGTQDCEMTELIPLGTLAAGTLQNRVLVDLPGAGLGLNANGLLFFSDATANVFIGEIAAATEQGNGQTRVYLKADLPGLGPDRVRVRGLSAPAGPENLNHPAALPNNYLSTASSTAAYTRGDPLGLRQGTTRIGAAQISKLEAQLQLDAPLTGLTAPLTVRTGVTGGATARATLTGQAQVLNFPPSPPPPARGEALVLTGNGATLPVVVTAENGTQRTVDRALTPTLGASGATVNWRRLTAGTTLGIRSDAPEAAAILTFEPQAVRAAPASGFILVDDRNGLQAARRITGLGYDALVLNAALPGNAAAPYGVERFTFQAPDLSDLTITRAQGLVLSPALSPEAVALQVFQFGTATLTPGSGTVSINNATVNNNVATAVPSNVATPGPSQLIGLAAGGNLTPALVRRTRLTVTLSRNLPAPTAPLEAVTLGVGGPRYEASRPAGSPDVVILRPRAILTGGGTADVEMPRLREGELVRADWTGGPGAGLLFRVRAVEGTTLTLEGSPALPASATPNLTITPLVPVTPATVRGSSRIGRAGELVSGVSNRATFEVWGQSDLRAGMMVGVVTGPETTIPVFINTADQVLVDFEPLAPFANAAGVNLEILTPAVSISAASFSRDGATIVLPMTTPALTPGPGLVLAVPYHSSGLSVNGEISGGSVLVPNDPENWEFTRRDALAAHELTHTVQYAKFGPLWLAPFPLFVVEGIVEAATDAELPRFSAYVDGTVRRTGDTRFLSVPSPGSLTLATGDHVQLSWSSPQTGPGGTVEVTGAGVPRSVVLGARQTDGSFLIDLNESLLPPQVTAVKVRKETGDSGWATFLDVMHFTTPGGLMNFVAGGYYGTLFWLIGKAFYGLGRAIFGAGDEYPVTVEEEGRVLRLTNQAGRDSLRGSARVIVKSGNSRLVRSVEGTVSETVRLASPVSFSGGEVKVSPYSTHTPGDFFDWHDYYPATLPDPARPATIRLGTVGTSSLTLAPFDRVVVSVGDRSEGNNVTAVNADGTVDLQTPPALGTETAFRLAKIGEGDPLGNVDSAYLTNVLGMDWMRWFFDPWGQLHFRTRPNPGSAGDVIARIARYAFGTQSWSLIPGFFFSVLFLDRIITPEHLSGIEQEASYESGDTYTPLGILRGGEPAVVGDIVRYWHVPVGGARDQDSLVMTSLFDTPGVHFSNIPRQMPFAAISTTGADEPNQGTQINPAQASPGRGVPDLFVFKNPTDPAGVPSDPSGFASRTFWPSNQGWIPVSPTLERTAGMYVAFCRPSFQPTDAPNARGKHRITISTATSADKGRDAQEKNKASLFYDKQVADVTVKVAGLEVAEGATVTLVTGQRALIAVEPNGTRRYRANLLRPVSGEVLRAEDTQTLLAQGLTATEPVEISRVYTYDSTADTFDGSVLNSHKLHLPRDVHIPVRSFTVEIVNTVPLRRLAGDLTSTTTDPVPRGQERFVVVPGPLRQPLRLTSAINADGTPNPTPLVPEVVDTPEAIRAFVGIDGGVFKIVWPTATALAQPVDLIFVANVGPAAPGFPVSVRLRVTP